VEKTTKLGASRSVLLTKYNSRDQITKNKMGGTGSTCRGEKRMYIGFGVCVCVCVET